MRSHGNRVRRITSVNVPTAARAAKNRARWPRMHPHGSPVRAGWHCGTRATPAAPCVGTTMPAEAPVPTERVSWWLARPRRLGLAYYCGYYGACITPTGATASCAPAGLTAGVIASCGGPASVTRRPFPAGLPRGGQPLRVSAFGRHVIDDENADHDADQQRRQKKIFHFIDPFALQSRTIHATEKFVGVGMQTVLARVAVNASWP